MSKKHLKTLILLSSGKQLNSLELDSRKKDSLNNVVLFILVISYAGKIHTLLYTNLLHLVSTTGVN